MKLSLFFLYMAIFGNIANASVEYHAGQSMFWDGSGQVSTSVYNFGVVSASDMTPERAKQLGYSQPLKSTLKDEWKIERNEVSGKIIVNRRAPRQFDSIITESKYKGVSWTDVSIFGENNSLIRRTVCREKSCFVVSKSICDKLTQATGQSDVAKAKELQLQCANLASTFNVAMTDAQKNSSLESDFKSDLGKASSTWGSRSIVMGNDFDAHAKNLYAYLSVCDSMKWYNKEDRQTGNASPRETPGKTR